MAVCASAHSGCRDKTPQTGLRTTVGFSQFWRLLGVSSLCWWGSRSLRFLYKDTDPLVASHKLHLHMWIWGDTPFSPWSSGAVDLAWCSLTPGLRAVTRAAGPASAPPLASHWPVPAPSRGLTVITYGSPVGYSHLLFHRGPADAPGLRDSSVDSQGPADPVEDEARAVWSELRVPLHGLASGVTQHWPRTREHAASTGPTPALPQLSWDWCWGRGFGPGVCAVGGCSLGSQLRPAVPLPTEPAGAVSGTAGRIPASKWHPPPAG